MDSKVNAVGQPIYYGEIQPWAKFMKAVFSGISIFVFMLALFGKDHNVRSFFRSLLLSSSPVLIDLLVVYYSIRENSQFKTKAKKIILYALVSSAVCFIISMIILLSSGNDIAVIDNYLNGSCWQVTLLLFPLIIHAFIINTFRPINDKNKNIKTEPR